MNSSILVKLYFPSIHENSKIASKKTKTDNEKCPVCSLKVSSGLSTALSTLKT